MKAAPTDSASYIEQMIANEKENQKSGYLKRIEELEKERKSAILLDKVINGGDIEGYKNLSSMKLDDRANNVKKTLRDRNYQGYDKCAPKDMNINDQNLTEVFSVINQSTPPKSTLLWLVLSTLLTRTGNKAFGQYAG